MSLAGTLLDVRTMRLPVSPTLSELRQMYQSQLDLLGFTAVGDVLVEVQPELFSNEVEVTYRARLGVKKEAND